MHRSRIATIAAACVLAATGGVVTLGIQPVGAATITVTTNADELNADGDCSLREALQAANTDAAVDACAPGSGADVVVLGADTYALTSQLVATDAAGLTLEGAGAGSTTIDGGDAVRIIDVTAGPLTLTALTATNGYSAPDPGGVVRADATPVTVNDAVISSSRGGHGGAINTNSGAVTINDSTFSDNRGEINALNGNGGAINTGDGPVTVRRATFAGNSVANVGGAIVTGSGAIDVADSTFTGNQALAGGAVYASFTTILLVNTTLDGNTTTDINDQLGGTVQTGGFPDSDITMRQVTLTGTITGIGIKAGADLTLSNTIIADNEGGDCQTFNTVTSLGGNLDSDGSCSLSEDSDLTDDPQLAPLADNGGPTETRFPEAGSPVIDSGVDAECESADQRGVARPQDGDDDGVVGCDRGAVEIAAAEEPPPPGPDSSTPGSDTGAGVRPRFTG